MAPSSPIIIDAGPALNFLASGHQRLLTRATAGWTLCAPATVEKEVLDKAARGSRFRGAAGRWRRMRARWITILSDDAADPGLVMASKALGLATSLTARQENGKDLGETMVVLHAYARAMTGQTVVVIIDDRGGRAFAAKAIRTVTALSVSGATRGRLMLTGTEALIERCLNTPDIPDKPTLRAIWKQISAMDDGLPDDVPQRLLTSKDWLGPQRP